MFKRFFKKKTKTLEEYLSKTKQVIVNNVIFEIKRVDTLSFLEGYNILLTSFATYEEKKDSEKSKERPEVTAKKYNELAKHLLCAAVVKPELSLKAKPHAICVDDVIIDQDLTSKLVIEIINFSKKNK